MTARSSQVTASVSTSACCEMWRPVGSRVMWWHTGNAGVARTFGDSAMWKTHPQIKPVIKQLREGNLKNSEQQHEKLTSPKKPKHPHLSVVQKLFHIENFHAAFPPHFLSPCGALRFLDGRLSLIGHGLLRAPSIPESLPKQQRRTPGKENICTERVREFVDEGLRWMVCLDCVLSALSIDEFRMFLWLFSPSLCVCIYVFVCVSLYVYLCVLVSVWVFYTRILVVDLCYALLLSCWFVSMHVLVFWVLGNVFAQS